MEIITGTTDFQINDETAVAIGKFDGVHIGHKCLIQEILDQKKNGRKACIFTFDPAPAVLFTGIEEKELTTKEEKRRLFEMLGVDILIEFPMTWDTANISPECFITEILCNKMNAVFVAAGEDLSFGAKGRGNTELLLRMSDECGLEVKVIKKIEVLGKEVSSTVVREAVESGNMPYVEKLLGMPYTIAGTVIHGNQIGRTVGMPTLNLRPDNKKLLPPRGVYYSEVLMDGKLYKGITNIGLRPTVLEKEKVMGVETYLYEFAGDAYDKEIIVNLLEFRREERKFESIEALKKTLSEDMEAGKLYIK